MNACDCPADQVAWHARDDHDVDCPRRTCGACWGCLAVLAIRQVVIDSRDWLRDDYPAHYRSQTSERGDS